MHYLLLFLEGIITFISPCLLPMLPIYVSFFAGGGATRSEATGGAMANEAKGGATGGEGGETVTPTRHKTLINALGFVFGFTLVFVVLGAFAGTAGSLLKEYAVVVNIVTGLIVIVFGLNFWGVIKIGFLNYARQGTARTRNLTFFSSILFGITFSIGWTPCVGAFLGSALMVASQSGNTFQGIIMLLFFSAGLGLPFVASALLIDQLKGAFVFIKRNYTVINIVSGALLVITGILIATGLMGYYLSLLSI